LDADNVYLMAGVVSIVIGLIVMLVIFGMIGVVVGAVE
jgi:hypothetical protein